mmetsp:Transcript_9451/g.14266  ORF Transcript_9451/g.14266 Transcript_9451/m.14266 type:complete len:434 (-) Transcript_9451:1119-2420(-)
MSAVASKNLGLLLFNSLKNQSTHQIPRQWQKIEKILPHQWQKLGTTRQLSRQLSRQLQQTAKRSFGSTMVRHGMMISGLGATLVAHHYMQPKDIFAQEALVEKEVSIDDLYYDKSSKPALSLLELIKTVLTTLLFVPIKLWIGCLTVFSAWLVSRIALLGYSAEWTSAEKRAAREASIQLPQSRPLTGWRRLLVTYPLKFLCRLLGHVCGFHMVHTYGEPAPASEAPIVVANHVSFLDPVLLMPTHWMCVLSKQAVTNMPFVGFVMKGLQTVFVDRHDQHSCDKARQELIDRAQLATAANRDALELPTFPPLLVFSEATTTSGQGLLKFKRGAFSAGQPVQPVVIRYPHENFNPALTYSRTLLSSMYRLMTQFYNSVEIFYMPVYYPSEAEKENPDLYAENVRKQMAKVLEKPATEFSYHDLKDHLKNFYQQE